MAENPTDEPYEEAPILDGAEQDSDIPPQKEIADESIKEKPIFAGERDPLGYLILPVFGLILVAVVVLWFQQRKDDDGQKFFPVTGRVTLKGKPLKGNFQVNFYSVKQDGPVASGLLREDGSFELTSGNKGQAGAIVGEYKVTIVMLEPSDVSWRIQDDPNDLIIDPNDKRGTIAPPDPDPPFPKEYSNLKLTPQRAIVGEQANVVNIDL